MATIIRFNIPLCVISLLDGYDEGKIINAVQSDLNGGTVKKSSSETRHDWKTVKNTDSEGERMVIIARSKAGETLQLENTIGNRFYSWCASVVRMNSFGTTTVELPYSFKTWLDKFAKVEVKPENEVKKEA